MKLRTKIAFFMSVLVTIAAVLYGVIIFNAESNALLNGMDSKLLATACLAKEILPANYHDLIQNVDSVSNEEYLRIVDRWNRLCKQLDLEYIWSLLLIDGRIVFTTGSSTSKETSKGDHAGFFEPHSNPELYQKVFRTMKTQYQINNDKWGRIRTVLVPFKDSLGRAYLFGASMKTGVIDSLQRKTLLKSFSISLSILILGLLISYFLSHSLTRPIEKLAMASREITKGYYTFNIVKSNIVEIDFLSQSICAMGHSIHKAMTDLNDVNESLQAEIIERKKASEVLDQRTSLLDTLLANLPIGVFMVEVPSGKPLVINQHAKDLLGRDILPDVNQGNLQVKYEAYKYGTNIYYPPEEMPITRGMKGEISYIDDMVVVRPDGTSNLLEIYGTPVLDKNKKPWASLACFSDITIRKQNEISLQESEKKFRALFENMTEGVSLHEIVNDDLGQPRDYRILSVNPAYHKHTGLAPDKVQGFLATEIYGGGKPPFLDEFAQVAQTGTPRAFETEFSPLGKHFNVSVISPKPNQFATVFEDITERKQKEKELKEKNEELARFTYTVSHDLKSPLVTIKTFLGYLQQDTKNQDTTKIEKDLGYIHSAADKMSRLLDELLELSRVGRKMNLPAEIPLKVVVNEALEMVAGRLAAQNIQVQVSEEPVILYGDRPRIVEIFQNLVDNAAKFMGNQQDPLVEIGVESEKSEIIFFVRDNGMGIDPRFKSKVFGLFEKLEPSSEGTGIGLALVKRIIETHNGRIWVESEGLGKGTTFRFTLEKTKRQKI